MEKQHCAVERFRNRPFCIELAVQALLEFRPSAQRNAVDRPKTAARHPFLSDGLDQAFLLELANSVIERADVHIDVAFDHRRLEPALDLIGMKIAPVEDAED